MKADKKIPLKVYYERDNLSQREHDKSIKMVKKIIRRVVKHMAPQTRNLKIIEDIYKSYGFNKVRATFI